MKSKGKLSIAGFLRIALVVIVILLQLALVGVLSYTIRNGAVFVYLIIEIIAILEILAGMFYTFCGADQEQTDCVTDG